MTPWIVCQLGAREHYAIPRALHQTGQLHRLITDAWVKPDSMVHRMPGMQPLCDRYHPGLAMAPVKAFTSSLIRFEATHRLKSTPPWERMMARNRWFQKQALNYLNSLKAYGDQPPVLFTYSYAALELLRYAKARGWRTVLGQIDPGSAEEKIVIAEHTKHPDLAPDWQPVPPNYWSSWQQECQLADKIIVNSAWSQQLLTQTGITPSKIEILPLAYAPPSSARSFIRTYPKSFSSERPLRVLFLGLVTLRKGIAALLEAIRILEGEPVEFWFVGPQAIQIPDDLLNHPQVRWIGSVPRSQVQTYYCRADIFIFPTLSDGFGLTQLEAQAWQLPIVASSHCGEVIQNDINGFVLSEVAPFEIASALRASFHDPLRLLTYAQQSNQLSKLDFNTLQDSLGVIGIDLATNKTTL